MSATMARQGGCVQLEQSDMRVTLNMAKMAKGAYLRAAMEDTQQLIKKPHAKAREEKKRGVEFPGHKKVKAAIKRHPAMVYRNLTAGCLPCQNGTPKTPQTRWRHKGTAGPPTEPAAAPPQRSPPPGTPPLPPGVTDRYVSCEIEGMPSKCVYFHSSHPNTEFFNHNAYAKDSKRNKDCNPDLLSTLSAAWKYRRH